MQGNPQQAFHYAYIAGLFDGEGSFCICKQKGELFMNKNKRKTPGYHPLIRIGMNVEKPLLFIKEVFGCGKVYNEGVRKEREHHKVMYRYQTTCKQDVIKIVDMLSPYLIVKKNQALLLKEFCETVKPPFNRKKGLSLEELQYREETYKKMRKLNDVGAAATTESSKAERSSDSLIS